MEDASSEKTETVNKKPIGLARLVSEIAKINPHWGRIPLDQESVQRLGFQNGRDCAHRPEKW